MKITKSHRPWFQSQVPNIHHCRRLYDTVTRCVYHYCVLSGFKGQCCVTVPFQVRGAWNYVPHFFMGQPSSPHTLVLQRLTSSITQFSAERFRIPRSALCLSVSSALQFCPEVNSFRFILSLNGSEYLICQRCTRKLFNASVSTAEVASNEMEKKLITMMDEQVGFQRKGSWPVLNNIGVLVERLSAMIQILISNEN